MPFSWWADPGMTAPLSRLRFTRSPTPGAVDARVYFGNPRPGTELQSASAPGVNALAVVLADADGTGGVELEDVQLATTAAGLDTATPGDALELGAVIPAGTAVEIFVRVDSLLDEPGRYADVSLTVPDWQELEV